MKTVNNREDYLRNVSEFIPTDSLCCELGVLNGDFSEKILEMLEPRSLVLVDPFEVNEQKYGDGLTTAYSTECQYESIVERFKGEPVFIEKGFSYNSVFTFPNSRFDFIYIDACHLYECVKRDLNDWLPKLKEGGIIGGHDYANIADFGVIQAVDEFCKEHNFEMIIFNENGGDWALKKK